MAQVIAVDFCDLGLFRQKLFWQFIWV